MQVWEQRIPTDGSSPFGNVHRRVRPTRRCGRDRQRPRYRLFATVQVNLDFQMRYRHGARPVVHSAALAADDSGHFPNPASSLPLSRDNFRPVPDGTRQPRSLGTQCPMKSTWRRADAAMGVNISMESELIKLCSGEKPVTSRFEWWAVQGSNLRPSD